MISGEVTNSIGHAIQQGKDMARIAVRVRNFSGRVMDVVLTRKDHYHYAIFTNFVHIKFFYYIIAALLAVYFFLNGWVSALVLLFCLILCYGIAFFLFFLLSFAQKPVALSYGFSERGMYLRDETSFLKLTWDRLKIKKSRHYYYAYYSWCSGWVIPRSEVNPWLEELLESHRKWLFKKEKSKQAG